MSADRWVRSVDPDPDPRVWPQPDESRLRDRISFDALGEGAGELLEPWKTGSDWADYERAVAEDARAHDEDLQQQRFLAELEEEASPVDDDFDRYDLQAWHLAGEIDDRPMWERDLGGLGHLDDVPGPAEETVPANLAVSSPIDTALPCSSCRLVPAKYHRVRRWGRTWTDLCDRCRQHVVRTGQLPDARSNYLQARRLGRLEALDELDEAA